MSVVQPRTTVVQPKSDFELLDGGRRLVFYSKSQSKHKKALVLALAVPVGLIIGGCLIVGIVLSLLGTDRNVADNLFWCAAIAFGVMFGVDRWSKKPTVRSIEFDEKSIAFDGKSYLLEHVSTLGWRSQSGYSVGGSGLQGAVSSGASRLSYETSGQVFMQYGADEIVVIRNLHPDSTRAVYDKIVGFLGQFGHKYGS